MGEVPLWGIEFRVQGAGCRMQVQGVVSNAEGIRRIVRKHDCALPAQYTKHSNARGHSLELGSEKALGIVIGIGLGQGPLLLGTASPYRCKRSGNDFGQGQARCRVRPVGG